MNEEMTVGELARQVGMTTRNIRAYQSRGLLYPPRIVGRTAYYSGVHASRLHLIASLQNEGFTLAAIKRLLETPGSYSAIVADRRRRFRDGEADMSATVPVSEDRIRALFPGAPDDLAETGLVWRDEHGVLVGSTVIVGVGRTLLGLGVAHETVARLQLEAVEAGRAIGGSFGESLAAQGIASDDLTKVAVQLSAAVFEWSFLDGAINAASAAEDAG